MLTMSTDRCHQVSDSSCGGEAEGWRGSQWGGELMSGFGFAGRVVHTYIFGYPLCTKFCFREEVAFVVFVQLDRRLVRSAHSRLKAGPRDHSATLFASTVG